MCPAHGRELAGELCLQSRLIMAAAGDGQPYQLCRAQRLTPTFHGGGELLNLLRVMRCSQLLVALRPGSDWSGEKGLRTLGLLYTRSWRGGLIIRVRSPGGQAEDGAGGGVSDANHRRCRRDGEKQGSKQSNAGG